jgi:hypothetical protein
MFKQAANVNDLDLRRRQQRLLIRSAELRASLSHSSDVIRTPLNLVDSARSCIQWLCRHPVYPTVALGALVLLKPRRALLWGSRLWSGWLSFQRVRQYLFTPIK